MSLVAYSAIILFIHVKHQRRKEFCFWCCSRGSACFTISVHCAAENNGNLLLGVKVHFFTRFCLFLSEAGELFTEEINELSGGEPSRGFRRCHNGKFPSNPICFPRLMIILILAQIFEIRRECHVFACFTQSLGARQRSGRVVVGRALRLCGRRRRRLAVRGEEKFPSSQSNMMKPTLVSGFLFATERQSISTTLNRRAPSVERTTKISVIRVFSSLRLRCCCFRSYAPYFFYSNDDASFYISRGLVFELESRQIFTSQKWNICRAKCI